MEQGWYGATYHQLVQAEHLGAVWQLVGQVGMREKYSLERMSLERDEQGFSYFSCQQSKKLELGVPYASMQLAVFVDVRSVLQSFDAQDYYLPFIVIPTLLDERMFGPVEIAIQHEVLHVKDLLRIVDGDPSYLSKVRDLALTNLQDADRLEDSVDFEVFKHLYFEERALSMEYRQGERTLRVPVLDSVFEYACASKEEYVELWLTNYLAGLFDQYMVRFPGKLGEIQASFDRALQKHGRHWFGAEVRLERLQKRLNAFMQRLFWLWRAGQGTRSARISRRTAAAGP